MAALACLPLSLAAGASTAIEPALAGPQELLFASEGNRLRRIDVDSIGTDALLEDVLIERAGGAEGGGPAPGPGRDVNGMICPIPDGSGRFVMGEDTGQPSPPAGWGVFDARGEQVGKLTATYTAQAPEPYGCAFDASGRLFTTEVGDQGFGANNGQLILWFPPFDRFPGPIGAFPETDAASDNFCKIATDVGTAGGVAIDAQGRVYVAAASGLAILRFSPPFPTGPDDAGGCGASDSTGAPLASLVQRETFARPDPDLELFTFSGLAIAPNGNLYAASVLTGRIGEYDLDGNLVRLVLDHDDPGFGPDFHLPSPFGSPQGIAVGADGSLYYADLDLRGVLPDVGPGPDGKLWRIRFGADGEPLSPEVVRSGLAFPDGVGALPGNFESYDWPTFAGGPRRQFFNHAEAAILPNDVPRLAERWRFPSDAIITASPAVARIELPGEGRVPLVFVQSWDGYVYAIRFTDGSEVWRFRTDEQPGASFPAAGSIDVSEVAGEPRVHVAAGEVMYALDSRTGREIWRFTAGTGCVGPLEGRRASRHRAPAKVRNRSRALSSPGLCAHDSERNEIESSPLVAGGLVLFGMDVNDSARGKGGFYAVHADDGRLAWFFDLESGRTCRPFPRDEVRYFDGYHAARELSLHPHFFETRPGCDFDRTPTGCGNVWSSAAYDSERGLVFVASSNCDTDDDPATSIPPPPMPPYDEAIFALRLDGTPAWRWRPREVDNGDLAFGATPNLFRIRDGGVERDVVGIGSKDGSYTVIGRDGVNERNGVAWDSPDPGALPYWRRQVVPGGSLGGIIGTPAVDEVARRIYFSTGPGGPANAPPFGTPQQPTLHALDMDTGAVVWGFGRFVPIDASFGPASGIPGSVFFGSVLPGRLRARRTHDDSGALLANLEIPSLGLASGTVAFEGTLLVGGGIGQRTGNPQDAAEITSRLPVPLTALCVPGAEGCPVSACSDGRDDDGDGLVDFAGGDTGCLSEGDGSEVWGDVDFDGDVDGGDAVALKRALGTRSGEPGFRAAADLDGDGGVGQADLAAWFDALAAGGR